ncbi:hypothetical protein E2320_006397, partial [Naja naja]
EARGPCPTEPPPSETGNLCLGQSCNSWQEEKRTYCKTWIFPMETDGQILGACTIYSKSWKLISNIIHLCIPTYSKGCTEKMSVHGGSHLRGGRKARSQPWHQGGWQGGPGKVQGIQAPRGILRASLASLSYAMVEA